MSQSRIGSLIEAIINTAIGFLITLALTPIIYPLFGHTFTAAQNIGITAIFTGVSVARGYVLRRWGNHFVQRAARKAAQHIEGS